jgi:hypothetical protein
MDALQFFPNDADMLETAKGRAFLVKKDIFRNLMWYSMADSNKHYPLTIETVKKIKTQNREGVRPEELETAEVITGKPKEIEPEYADIVGQISLKSLEKTTRKRRDKERGQQQQRGGQQGGAAPQQQRGPRQQGQGPAQGQPSRNRPQQQPQQGQRPAQQRPPQQQGPRPARPQQGGPTGGQQQGRPQRPPQNRGPRPPRPDGGRPDNQPPKEG